MHDDEQAIRQLVSTWMDATRAGDTQAVLDLMADDALFLVPGQPPFGKDAFAQAARHQAQAALQFDGASEILEIKVLGDWAYLVSRLSVTARQPGQDRAITRRGHTLTILRRQGGKWLLARDANLLGPADDA